MLEVQEVHVVEEVVEEPCKLKKRWLLEAVNKRWFKLSMDRFVTNLVVRPFYENLTYKQIFI